MRGTHAEDAPFSFEGRCRTEQDRFIRNPHRPILHAAGASSKEGNMQLQMKSPVVALAAGEVLTLDDAEGTRIVSRSGTVWITEEGSRKDHIVGPGDAIVIARPGRTVVQALHPAWISIAHGPGAANDPLQG
jgi:hypothetical protein